MDCSWNHHAKALPHISPKLRREVKHLLKVFYFILFYYFVFVHTGLLVLLKLQVNVFMHGVHLDGFSWRQVLVLIDEVEDKMNEL